jgi:hypothetical protein
MSGIPVVTLFLLIFLIILYIISIEVRSGTENNTSQNNCNHNWEPYYNSKEAAQIYNDGLNAYTDRYICTKCGKKKKGEKYYI